MECYKCGKSAVGQCQMCGKFYCKDHGDVACNDCRPGFERAVEERRFGPFSRYLIPIAYFAFCAIGGGMLGFFPVILVREVSPEYSACLVPICPPAGFIAGLAVAVASRGRIERRAGMRGLIGGLLLALLFACLACNIFDTTSALLGMRRAQQMRENALKMGLPVPESAARTGLPMWGGLLISLAVYGVVSLVIVVVAVRLMSPKTESSEPTSGIAEDENQDGALVGRDDRF